MTITISPARDEYVSSAGQSIFDYTFKIYANDELNVFVTPSGSVPSDSTDLTTSYTVDPGTIGSENGGFITFTAPLNNGDQVTITSGIPYNRTVDYQNNGDFRPETVNGDNDRQVSQIKQLVEDVGRTVVFEQSVQNSSGLTMPAPEAGKFVKWKSDESGFENTDIIDPATVPSNEVLYFGSVAELTASSNALLLVGMNVVTTGYYVSGDGGGADYIVRGAQGVDEFGDHTLLSGNVVIAQSINAKSYGFTEGDIDYADRVQAFFDLDLSVISFDGMTIRCDTNITLSSDKTYKNGGLDFSQGADDLFALTGTGAFEASVDLTSNASFFDTTLIVGDASSFAAGDTLYLSDDQEWSTNTPQGEYVTVKSIAVNTITLTAKTAGSYLVGSNAKLEKLLPIENIVFDKFSINGKLYSGTETQNGLTLTNCKNVSIRSGCNFDRFAQRLIRLVRTLDVSITSSTFSDSDQGGFGYGVAVADGCQSIRIIGNTFDNMRHAVTLGGSSGVNRYVVASNNTCTGMKDAMMDTHIEADFTTFTDNIGTFVEDNASDDAITLQGGNAIVTGNICLSPVRNGILCQPAVKLGLVSRSISLVFSNNAFLAGGTGTGITIETKGTKAYEGISVTGNTMQNFEGRGISVTADTAGIDGLNISSNTISSIGLNGVFLATTSGTTIKGFTISNNIMLENADTVEAIRLLGGGAADIAIGVINGNVIRNGTNGIRMTAADNVIISSNQTSGLSGATVNIGSSTNITQANNV